MTDTPPAPPADPIVTPSAESPAVEACKRDRIKEVLAYGALAYMAAFTALVFFRGVPEGASGAIVDTLAAAAVLQAKEVFGFVFGSSQGSQDKTAALAASIPAPVTPPTPPNS